ncbi:MAG: FAD-dependent oxidoreductase, partial [Planctomycetes bacterium]|nr:FAD-dependent oxidoreductase [Planctomycetota bacterium]
LTRIYYKNKYFNYPIKAFDTLYKLGLLESSQAMLSFIASKFRPKSEPKTFEDWISQKFGRKLYETFFKTYTEKVWGIPCNQIGAEWAAQRIKGLDIVQVIKKAMFGNKSKAVKTLVEQFDYPRLGAGQMYEVMADQTVSSGGELILGSRVTVFNRDGNAIKSIAVNDGKEETLITANHYFTSIPITHFVKMLSPVESKEVINAAEALYYREHITVNLLIDKDDVFPDQWIYIHSPDVKMARIANYNNFSKDMVGHNAKTALSVEYFVFQHDNIWKRSDDELKDLAIEELSFLNIVDPKRVESAWVVRETESYPTYYLGFKDHYDILRKAIDKYTNLSAIGRGGMYKYNNQDHSTLSGILAARNYLKLSGSPYDLWSINIDAEYLESGERVSD